MKMILLLTKNIGYQVKIYTVVASCTPLLIYANHYKCTFRQYTNLLFIWEVGRNSQKKHPKEIHEDISRTSETLHRIDLRV